MLNTFKAELVTDVSYRDFAGKLYTYRAGTVVEVYQAKSTDGVCVNASGKTVSRPIGRFVAIGEKFNFVLKPFQFRLFN